MAATKNHEKRSARPPVGFQEAAQYIGTSERHIRRLVSERRIPHVRVGGTRIKFDLDTLDQWLIASRVEAVK